jgi:hypothetical protein
MLGCGLKLAHLTTTQEIEKTAQKQALHTLLMPWELGKLPAASSHEVIETSKVIWVCTSNAGEELVFEFSHSKDVNTPSTRNEYAKLMVRMRGRLADELGVRWYHAKLAWRRHFWFWVSRFLSVC